MKHFNIEQLWYIIMKITLELEELFFGPHSQVNDIPQVQLLETEDCSSTVYLVCLTYLQESNVTPNLACLGLP